MKKKFEEIPPQNRGNSTLHSFLNIKTLTKVMDDLRLKLVTRAWRRIGGRPFLHWTTLTSRRRLGPSVNGIVVLIYANSCYQVFIQAHLVIVWLNYFCTTLTRRNATTDCPPSLCVEEFYQAYGFFSLVQLFSSKNINLVKFDLYLADIQCASWTNQFGTSNAQGYYNTSSFTMSLLRFFMLLENHVFFLIVF